MDQHLPISWRISDWLIHDCFHICRKILIIDSINMPNPFYISISPFSRNLSWHSQCITLMYVAISTGKHKMRIHGKLKKEILIQLNWKKSELIWWYIYSNNRRCHWYSESFSWHWYRYILNSSIAHLTLRNSRWDHRLKTPSSKVWIYWSAISLNSTTIAIVVITSPASTETVERNLIWFRSIKSVCLKIVIGPSLIKNSWTY